MRRRGHLKSPRRDGGLRDPKRSGGSQADGGIVPADLVAQGRALCDLGRYDEAVIVLTSAIERDPRHPDAHVALGLAFEAQGRTLDAFNAYQKALEHSPKHATAYNNLAGILIALGQIDLAVATGRMAVSLAPDHPDVPLNLALALRLRGDEEEALGLYKRIVALKPDHGFALVELCHYRQHACDWDGLGAQHEAAAAHSYRKGELVSPFAIMAASASALDQLLCAQVWSERFKALPGAPLASYAPRPAQARQRRVRLGYLSADFHHHATAMLIVDMIEQHDHARFELFGYSLGPDDGSALRRRLVAAFDRFVDLRAHTDADAARLIRDDDIDILLDLKGFTRNARVKILAFEPAPIQVNYLGFPGTMGLPCMDYIIADAHVLPQRHEAFFSEKIVRLPHSYQPNDRNRAATVEPSRAECGLPEGCVVFCCFNSPYKITPDLFAAWMRLLREVPGSVLWLLTPNRQAGANLHREAARHGVGAERLVFAPFVPADEHLARLPLADLFLDTYPVNAHTTASEALWAGLPLLTWSGETFASRVAGSLLHAIGVPDLVTDSLAEYAALALALARDPERLAILRNRLRENRASAPLFDTVRYTRNFERALLEMVKRREAGLPAQTFDVVEMS